MTAAQWVLWAWVCSICFVAGVASAVIGWLFGGVPGSVPASKPPMASLPPARSSAVPSVITYYQVERLLAVARAQLHQPYQVDREAWAAMLRKDQEDQP